MAYKPRHKENYKANHIPKSLEVKKKPTKLYIHQNQINL